MPVEIADVVRRVAVTAQTQLPHIDWWQPDPNLLGGFFDPSGRSNLQPPLLLLDDGNLLLALISATSKDGGQTDESWARFANSNIRMLGNLLHRAALDYGMHRLLLVLVLPDSQDIARCLTAELAKARYTAGQFRIILLPHRNQETPDFQQQLESQLNLLSPFPLEPFLEPIAQSELAGYVSDVFGDGSYKDSPFRIAVEQDLKTYLQSGAWAHEKEWPAITSLLESELRPALDSTEGR